VQCADRVLMLHRGELIEQGTHAELLAETASIRSPILQEYRRSG
jgi:ABC-type multidrug transport system fused ATPase/permease subunit